MSYILDALRRADAERSRGAVPGLHAQSVPADTGPAVRQVSPLVWVAGGLGVVLVAGVVLLLVAPWRGGAPVPAAVSAPVPVPDARVAATSQSPLPEPTTPPAPRDAAPPTAGAPPQPGTPEPAARAVEPPTGRAPYPPPQWAPPTQAAPPPPAREAAPRVEHYGAPLPAPPAPATTTVPNINDLAPNVRAQLPRLAVGGSIYSDTPSARMVILNGQVFHEGDKPAADTVLEQIHPKSAQFNCRGQRYVVTF